MTPEQYDRWKDFAVRMARTCWTNRNRPSRDWIVEQVAEVFGQLDPKDIVSIKDWDNSEPYPEGHPYYRRTYRRPCWHCKTPPRKPDCPYRCEDAAIFDYAHAAYMCDWMTEWEDFIYDDWQRYATVKEARRIEAAREPDYEHLRALIDKWANPVGSCIRAGLDCASAPSAGVLGFTAGDIRRMYPEGVPEWVFSPDKRLVFWPSGELDGFFEELPDDAGVVL
jgi:hypothetical protein